jgi:hypothetical protein
MPALVRFISFDLSALLPQTTTSGVINGFDVV